MVDGQRTVLVLTRAGDSTSDMVMRALEIRDARVFRVDAADFLTRLSLDAYIDGGHWVGQLRHASGGAVDLASVHSVYLRHPTQFQLAGGMSGPEAAWSYREARMGFGGIVQALSRCDLVNDPVAAARCAYKPIQLAAAGRCGLRTPTTLITNDPDRACEWVRKLRPRSTPTP